MSTRNYFFACTLSKDSPVYEWKPTGREDDEDNDETDQKDSDKTKEEEGEKGIDLDFWEDPDYVQQDLCLAKVQLDHTAPTDEATVVVLESKQFDGKSVSAPIAFLRAPLQMACQLDGICISSANPVKLRLTVGKGPVHVTGTYAVEIREEIPDETMNMGSLLTDEEEEDVSHEELDELVSESKKQQLTPAAAAKNGGGAGGSKKKKQTAKEDSDEEDEEEEEEEDEEEDPPEEDSDDDMEEEPEESEDEELKAKSRKRPRVMPNGKAVKKSPAAGKVVSKMVGKKAVLTKGTAARGGKAANK